MLLGEDRVWELARAFTTSRVLLTAVELGVFAVLGDESMTSEAVASKLGTDARATDRLMNSLVVLNFLSKSGDRFSNAPDVREFLVPGNPSYIGGALMHIVNLWNSWSTLTDAVKAGTSVIQRDERGAADFTVPFIAAMDAIASGQATELVELIDLEGVQRVLDVGGGSGAYSIEFCRAKPGLEAVVFDTPIVVPLTKGYIEKAGLTGRITTTTGDFNKDELGRDFDLVFLSQVLHSNNPEENIELFKRSWRALKPGGRVVIQEFVVDENRTSPPMAVLFALNMLVATRAGDTYTEDEIKSWLSNAGFGKISRIDPKDTNSTLIIANKE